MIYSSQLNVNPASRTKGCIQLDIGPQHNQNPRNSHVTKGRQSPAVHTIAWKDKGRTVCGGHRKEFIYRKRLEVGKAAIARSSGPGLESQELGKLMQGDASPKTGLQSEFEASLQKWRKHKGGNGNEARAGVPSQINKLIQRTGENFPLAF